MNTSFGSIKMPYGITFEGYVHSFSMQMDTRYLEGWWEGTIQLQPEVWKQLDLVEGCVVHTHDPEETIKNVRVSEILVRDGLTEVRFTTRKKQ